jgi:WD40 repeat protein
VVSLCFDPSGQWLLFNTHPYSGEAGLIHLSTYRVQRIHAPGTGDSAFSPDGRQLAYHSGSDLMMGPVGDLAATRTVYTHPIRLPMSLAWHPNQPWLASTENRRLVVLDASTGRPKAELDIEFPPHGVAWDPHGAVIALGSYDSSLVDFWDIEAGRKVHSIDLKSGSNCGLQWLPECRLLIFSAQDEVLFADPEPGTVLRRIPCGFQWRGARADPSECFLAAPDEAAARGNFGKQLIIWDIAELTGARRKHPVQGTALDYIARQTVTVGRLATAPQPEPMWVPEALPEADPSIGLLGVLRGTVANADHRICPSMAFHPNSRELFTGSPDGKLRRWRLSDARELWSQKLATYRLLDLSISPDGLTVAV